MRQNNVTDQRQFVKHYTTLPAHMSHIARKAHERVLGAVEQLGDLSPSSDCTTDGLVGFDNEHDPIVVVRLILDTPRTLFVEEWEGKASGIPLPRPYLQAPRIIYTDRLTVEFEHDTVGVSNDVTGLPDFGSSLNAAMLMASITEGIPKFSIAKLGDGYHVLEWTRLNGEYHSESVCRTPLKSSAEHIADTLSRRHHHERERERERERLLRDD